MSVHSNLRCTITSLAAVLLLFAAGCDRQQTGPVGGPLDWPQIPRGWHVTYERKDGRDTYTAKPRRGADPLLVRKWPANLADSQLAAQMTKIADLLVTQSQSASKVTLVTTAYQVEPVSGDNWRGSQVIFRFKGNITGKIIEARLFVINLGGETWE